MSLLNMWTCTCKYLLTGARLTEVSYIPFITFTGTTFTCTYLTTDQLHTYRKHKLYTPCKLYTLFARIDTAYVYVDQVKVVGGAKGFLWGTLVLVMYLSDHKSN